jgi:two-component system response regulator DevR
MAASPDVVVTAYIRVLVTDDHPVVREGITAILDADPNISVIGEAGSGEEAIAHIEVLHPDVVLLDLRLPRMSGINACLVIRRRFPRIGTLMLTATATHSALKECMDAGAHGFVSKNVGPATLREAVYAVSRGATYVDAQLTAAECAGSAGGRRQVGVHGLTRQERRVLELLPSGLTNRGIGEHLGLGEATVKSHLYHAMQKLGLSTRSAAAALVEREGLA